MNAVAVGGTSPNGSGPLKIGASHVCLRVAALLLFTFCFQSWSAAGATNRRRAASPPQAPPAVVAVDGVTVSLVSPPAPVAARQLQILAWELVVENKRSDEITLTSLEVISGGDTLLTYSGVAIRPIIANVPERTSSADLPGERIRAGELAVIYLWLTARDSASVPQQLTHRIRYSSSGQHTIDGPIAQVSSMTPPTFSTPLSGDRWLAANGPANDSVHRRAVTLIGNRFQNAQRFAIDWVRLDVGGSTHTGDGHQNSTYYAYGVDVLAVADAVVASTRDGIPENPPQQPPPFRLDTAAGNYVILDLGGGNFALYAHLQPGSLRVKAGDAVHRGEALARLGNSGNSTEPHLHFHVCDANAPLACDGLPWTLDRFLTQDGGRLSEIPLKDDLVSFP